MSSEHGSAESLTRVLAWVLALVLGGIGGVGVWLGTELWHLAVGLPLMLLAAWLIRAAQ